MMVMFYLLLGQRPDLLDLKLTSCEIWPQSIAPHVTSAVLRTPNIGYKLEFHDPVLCQLATEVNAKHQFFYLNEQHHWRLKHHFHSS